MAKSKKKYTKDELEQKAVSLLWREKQNWEVGVAFITERVAFNMRNLIRQCRKNYWGVFDSPLDPQTGRKKIWPPLTESTVEAVVKNIDVDTKDINFRATTKEAVGTASLVRHIVKDALDKMFFGEYLDMLTRQLSIDGTVVWKTYEEYDEKQKKKVMKVKWVDLLNFYIDPVAESIQTTPSVIERAVITVEELKSMKGWVNTDLVKGATNIDPVDNQTQGQYNTRGETPLVEVYERWGLMPKSIITGLKEDDNTLIEGRICVSNVGGSSVFHYAEENKKGLKPYEEAWYTRVPGRWYGKGVAEKLLMLQLWLNTIINIRINRSYIAQLGIFKIRNGSGVTPQMISRLASNGAILVNDINDIEQMAMQEASQASYTDEGVIQNWAQRVTSAYEVVVGEAMPASTSATATAVSAQGATSQFTLIKEGVGMFIQRWLKRHALPLIVKNLGKGDIVRLSSSEDITKLAEAYVGFKIQEEVNKIHDAGFFVDPAQVERAKMEAVQRVKNSPEFFVELEKAVEADALDVQVYVTNEEFDKGVMTQNLLLALQSAPQYVDQILPAVFDMMGIGPFKAQQMPMMPQASPAIPAKQNMQQSVTRANTMQPMGNL